MSIDRHVLENLAFNAGLQAKCCAGQIVTERASDTGIPEPFCAARGSRGGRVQGRGLPEDIQARIFALLWLGKDLRSCWGSLATLCCLTAS